MIVKSFGLEFEFTNSIITIGSISFDVSKAEEWVNENKITAEGELARLYLNTLGWPETTKTVQGQTVTFPARVGIDLSTATFEDMVDYLNTTTEKMSESLRELIRKTMKARFSSEFTKEVRLVSSKLKTEYQLIDNETQSIDSLGKCGGGVLGEVRLDGSTFRIPKKVEL